jgi:hypothetical protein
MAGTLQITELDANGQVVAVQTRPIWVSYPVLGISLSAPDPVTGYRYQIDNQTGQPIVGAPVPAGTPVPVSAAFDPRTTTLMLFALGANAMVAFGEHSSPFLLPQGVQVTVPVAGRLLRLV